MNSPLLLSRHVSQNRDPNLYDGTLYGLAILVPVLLLFAAALALAIHA